MEALLFFIWLTMKGVQSIHEPHKLTSGASLFVKGSPNQLLAKRNSLRASYYVCQAPQLSQVRQLHFQNQISGFYSHLKLFFQKISKCQ